MRANRLLFALPLVLSLHARAADKQPFPLPVDPFASVQRTPESGEPDHLIPVDPYPRDWYVRYKDQIRTRFELAQSCDLQMLVCPSFTAEYVVRMHGNWRGAEKVILSYSVADKNIWYSMPENNGGRKQQKVMVSTKTADLLKPFADRLHKVWGRMLRLTRYPIMPVGGADGTTYEFSTGGAYGEVWSPNQHQSPLLFVELGESLVACCKASPAERPAAIKAIEDKAARLEKYLDEHQSK